MQQQRGELTIGLLLGNGHLFSMASHEHRLSCRLAAFLLPQVQISELSQVLASLLVISCIHAAC